MQKLLLALVLGIFLIPSTSAVADYGDDLKARDQKTIQENKSGSSSKNPSVGESNNPAMVKPSDPTGVNSNTPGSSGIPPSSAPGMNSGNQSPLAPPSGH